jgi:flagella basal body P-ring formation protein FlgA
MCLVGLMMAAPLAAQPIDGPMAVALVQAAMQAAGMAPAAMAPPQRPLPACAHPPAVAPFQGRWTAAELTCSGPVPWRRVLRVAAGPDAAPPRQAAAALPEEAQVVLVAARALRRGHRMAPGDLLPARLAGVDPAQAVVRPQDAIGRRLRTAVGRGQPMLERQLEPALAVEPGQRVDITARDGGLAVAIEGEALQGGGVGDVVRVRVLSGGREIEAEISGPRRVTVTPKISADAAVTVSKRRSP